MAAVVAIDRGSFSLPWPEHSFRYELTQNEAGHLLVAELAQDYGQKVVGFLGYWLILDEVHISTLAVDPAHRRSGIGSRLLAAALKQARKFGARSATLEVRASNSAAIRLYQRFGFRIVGRRKAYYSNNREDALLMTQSSIAVDRDREENRRGG